MVTGAPGCGSTMVPARVRMVSGLTIPSFLAMSASSSTDSAPIAAERVLAGDALTKLVTCGAQARRSTVGSEPLTVTVVRLARALVPRPGTDERSEGQECGRAWRHRGSR